MTAESLQGDPRWGGAGRGAQHCWIQVCCFQVAPVPPPGSGEEAQGEVQQCPREDRAEGVAWSHSWEQILAYWSSLGIGQLMSPQHGFLKVTAMSAA